MDEGIFSLSTCQRIGVIRECGALLISKPVPGLVQPPAGHSLWHWPGILQSVGIFAVSVSGHSSLPVLRTSMRQPRVRYLQYIQNSLLYPC